MNTFSYRSAPDLQWTVETTGLLLVRPATGVCQSLKYPEAALWDFLTRGHGLSKVTKMMRYIGGFRDETEAAEYIQDRLRMWVQAGLVVEHVNEAHE